MNKHQALNKIDSLEHEIKNLNKYIKSLEDDNKLLKLRFKEAKESSKKFQEHDLRQFQRIQELEALLTLKK